MTLPDLMPISNYDASKYIGIIYAAFKRELVDGNLSFLDLPITFPWKPPYDNKHFCFWHSISERGDTNNEDDRIPNMSRCERILWIPYVITNALDQDKIWCWEKSVKTKRGRSKHIQLFFHEENYLIVLRRKANRLEFVTAYVRGAVKMKQEKERYHDPR